MKKATVFLSLLLAIVCVLSACSGAAAPAGNNAQTADTAQEAAVSGETVDVGDFTVLVPNGWMKFPQTDMWAEKDEDGNAPLRTDAYGMIQNGKNEWDAFTNPTVYVYYYHETSAKDQGESSLWFYEQSEEIEVTVGGKSCAAWKVVSEALSEDGDDDIYQLIFLPVTETSCFQITVPVSISGKDLITFEDPDVMAIMESLTVKS